MPYEPGSFFKKTADFLAHAVDDLAQEMFERAIRLQRRARSAPLSLTLCLLA